VHSAADDVHAAILAAGGPIPFARFMDLALYGPNGFYATHGTAGRRGDFLTSPEVGPLFGVVISRYLDSVWTSLGRPDRFDVVEVGAGPGTLARSILRSGAECLPSINYVAVEVSATQRERHPDGITSSTEMPFGPITGVVLANELLDNLPFRLMVFDGAWRESYIASTPNGFVEELRPIEHAPGVVPDGASHGSRIPIQDSAREWVQRTLKSIKKGRLLLVDYGRRSTSEVVGLGWREWLRTYAQHGRGAHYLKDVGLQDITCDVMFDQVFADADVTYRSQAEFLVECGIETLVAEGRTYWESHASRPDVTAMAMRSRVSEAEALLDPAGLGGFTVAEVDVS